MIIENVNDILSMLTLLLFIVVPLYFVLGKISSFIRNFNERRIQKLMKEDDWHM